MNSVVQTGGRSVNEVWIFKWSSSIVQGHSISMELSRGNFAILHIWRIK